MDFPIGFRSELFQVRLGKNKGEVLKNEGGISKNKGEVSKNEGGISKNEGGISKMCVSPRQK